MSFYREVRFFKRSQGTRTVILQHSPVIIDIGAICWAKRSGRKQEVLAGDMSSQSTFKDITVYEIGLADNSKWIIPMSEISKLEIEVEEGPVTL
jgi:hypothetical protein|tara:strand:- start:97 stop:378 length:282 start_codon:yes stop_codon:yes gene_type:complete